MAENFKIFTLGDALIMFNPIGGINLDNTQEWLEAGAVAASRNRK